MPAPVAPERPAMVAFDLDDTLAPSKAPLPDPVVTALRALLDVTRVCVISGGQIEQFRTQLVGRLGPLGAAAPRLHLMPTCGTQYWTVDGDGALHCVYHEDLTADEKRDATAALQAEAQRLGLWEADHWGERIEDRGSQITFSALGQHAPLAAKQAWDPTGEKKNRLRAAVQADLPGLEVRSGGSTSVDITRRGIDKAYGMRRLAEITGIGADDTLFVGDRLDPDGNDYPVKAMGVPTRSVTGWEDTVGVIEGIVAAF